MIPAPVSVEGRVTVIVLAVGVVRTSNFLPSNSATVRLVPEPGNVTPLSIITMPGSKLVADPKVRVAVLEPLVVVKVTLD